MYGDIFSAFFIGFIPVAALTFLIMQWSISSGRMQPFNEDEDPRNQYKDQMKAEKARRKAAKKEKVKYEYDEDGNWISGRKGGDFLHGKIMEFGGGYYGIMAFFTYILIEIGEIADFLKIVFTPGAWFQNLGIQLIVEFFINSIMNFVYAMIWFITLQKYFSIQYGLVWLAMTYAGYYTGLKLTSMHGDTLWAKLIAFRGFLIARAKAFLNQYYAKKDAGEQ